MSTVGWGAQKNAPARWPGRTFRDATDRGEDYFFLVVVFFAADLVVFFETDFLAAAMGPPFVGKSHMSQQEDYSIQNTIPSGKIDSGKIFYTTGALGAGCNSERFHHSGAAEV
jgi:hypothetical protein